MSLFASYSKILEIVGDIIRVEVPAGEEVGENTPRFNDLAVLQNANGSSSLAQVIDLKQGSVALQVFPGSRFGRREGERKDGLDLVPLWTREQILQYLLREGTNTLSGLER